MRKLIFAVAFLLPSILRAQAVAGNPPLQIFADTAGVAPWPGGNNVYATWIFAKASPTSLPSSGILVAFNCSDRTVKRLAHVVYQLVPHDSTRVYGQVQPDDGPWVKPVIPKLFAMICSIGVQHGVDDGGVPAPTDPRWQHDTTAAKPESPYPVT